MVPDVTETETLMAADMDVELHVIPSPPLSSSPSNSERGVSTQRNREENDGDLIETSFSKKQRLDRSVEEERLEKIGNLKSEELETEVVGDVDDSAAVQQALEVDEIVKLEAEVAVGEKTVVNGAENIGNKLKESGVERETEESENKVVVKREVFEEDNVDKVEEITGPVSLGPKTFNTSVQMFDYFSKLLSHWSPHLDLNKYEHMVLMELVRKGCLDPEEKMGEGGVRAFQIRSHPQWKSKCYYIIRADGTAVDFSFRKCVNHILPLPDNMQINNDINKMLAGRRGRGRGRGSGGRHHNPK